MKVSEGKKIYFASDNHLGIPDSRSSLIREKKFVKWLDTIKVDAHSIYLLGDLFDFWFEYKTVVPKGFTRVLGKIAKTTINAIIPTLIKPPIILESNSISRRTSCITIRFVLINIKDKRKAKSPPNCKNKRTREYNYICVFWILFK